MSHPRIALHRYTLLTSAATFALLVAGGLVTSTDSGLAVPDWPLSYGTWFPPMVGGIRYEHSHRMMAGAVGLLILGLAVWIWRTESRRWVRRLSLAALTAVVVQALLGALTVLLVLPAPLSIAHACLGPAVFCLVVCTALATSPAWQETPIPLEDAGQPPLCVLGMVVAGLAAMQLLLGAVLRHTGMGVSAHVLGAVLLLGAIGITAVRIKRTGGATPLLGGMMRRLEILWTLQLVLGLAALRWREAAGIATAHVGVGALFLAQSVVLAWQIHRRTAPPARS